MISKRVLSLIATAVLVVAFAAACGDDGGGGDGGGGDGGGGDAEAFCDRIEELDDEDAFESEDVEASVEAFESLAEDAPEEVQDELDTIREAYDELNELDEDDPDTFEDAFEILLDEELIEATEAFGEFLEEECGLEDVIESGGDLTDDLSDLSDFSDDTSDDFSDDVSDDFSDAFSDDFSDDPDVNEASVLRDFLEAEYPDIEGGVGGIGSVALAPGEVEFTITLNEDADPETGNGICDAVLDFGEQEGYDVLTVEVEDAEDTVLATGELGVGCEAA